MGDIWNKRPSIFTKFRLWWQRLWVRKNELHSSLSLDTDLMNEMCECEQRRYQQDLTKRRMVAHWKDDQRDG